MGSFTDDGWADSLDDMNRAYNRHQDAVRSRRAEFGTGAHFKEEHPNGEQHVRSAIEAVGGDPSKYAGPITGWDEASIRLVEEERTRSQRDWD